MMQPIATQSTDVAALPTDVGTQAGTDPSADKYSLFADFMASEEKHHSAPKKGGAEGTASGDKGASGATNADTINESPSVSANEGSGNREEIVAEPLDNRKATGQQQATTDNNAKRGGKYVEDSAKNSDAADNHQSVSQQDLDYINFVESVRQLTQADESIKKGVKEEDGALVDPRALPEKGDWGDLVNLFKQVDDIEYLTPVSPKQDGAESPDNFVNPDVLNKLVTTLEDITGENSGKSLEELVAIAKSVLSALEKLKNASQHESNDVVVDGISNAENLLNTESNALQNEVEVLANPNNDSISDTDGASDELLEEALITESANSVTAQSEFDAAIAELARLLQSSNKQDRDAGNPRADSFAGLPHQSASNEVTDSQQLNQTVTDIDEAAIANDTALLKAVITRTTSGSVEGAKASNSNVENSVINSDLQKNDLQKSELQQASTKNVETGVTAKDIDIVSEHIDVKQLAELPEVAQKSVIEVISQKIVTSLGGNAAQAQEQIKGALQSAIAEFNAQVAQGREPGINLQEVVSQTLTEAGISVTPDVQANVDQQLNQSFTLLSVAKAVTAGSEINEQSGSVVAAMSENSQIQSEASKSLQQSAGLEKPVNFTKPEGQQQLAEKIRWMVNARQTMAEIRLDPPELGSMQVRVNVAGEAASVSFVVQSAAAREAIADAMPKLRDMLAEQGIELGESHVQQQDEKQSQDGQDKNGSAFTHSGFGAEDEEEIGHLVEQRVSRNLLGGIDDYA